MVRFLVEKGEKGIKVTVKGKPDTEGTIPFKVLKESVSREATPTSTSTSAPRPRSGTKAVGCPTT